MDDLALLKAKLDAVNGEALRQAERKALKAMGQVVLEAITAKAPVRTGKDQRGGDLAPGELKAGFKVSVHIASDQSTTTGDTSHVRIGPNKRVAHVARFVENGHANPKSSKNANTPAHPFVRPAFDESEQKAIDTYTAIMTEEITKAFNNA